MVLDEGLAAGTVEDDGDDDDVDMVRRAARRREGAMRDESILSILATK